MLLIVEWGLRRLGLGLRWLVLLMVLVRLRLLRLRLVWLVVRVLLLLLPGLQHPLLLLQTVGFPDNPRIVGRRLHGHCRRPRPRILLHPGMGHHLHRHLRCAHGPTGRSRHPLQLRAALIDANARRHPIGQSVGHPIRGVAGKTGSSRGVRQSVRNPSRRSIHHRLLLVGQLTGTLRGKIGL